MDKLTKTKRIAIFIIITIVNILLARYAALTLSNVPGIVTFYFAVAFMIPFTLWFGVWGAVAAYIGCVVGSGIPAGLSPTVNIVWSLADLWQVAVPLVALMLLKLDVGLRTKKSFGVFLLLGVVLNNLAGALWGSSLFVLSGQFAVVDFASLFENWFFGNLVVTLVITLPLLWFVTPPIKRKNLWVATY